MVKIGLEIHQRLATKKLFCSCPALAAEPEDNPDQTLRRKLHPVFSELGEIDAASRAEFEKGKTFIYQAFSQSDCLVETDEEPPHGLDEEALLACLEIASHLNAKPVDELHVMRKIVIDGSNTSGFQRTSIVAMDGTLQTSRGPIRIPLIAIEEDSAGIVGTRESGNKTQDVGFETTYRLDRLGTPLIEINTDPEIIDGDHLLEIAEKIGMMMRATGKVARGLGTIRQDVNISTERGARVEIKGAQDLKLLATYAKIEISRQDALIGIVDELHARLGGNNGKAKSIALKGEIVNLTSIFTTTQSPMISKGIQNGASVFGVLLEKHAGLLGREIQPGKRYGTELSEYAKAAGVKGIIHSDEDLGKYNISKIEMDMIRSALKIQNPQDAFVIVVAPESQAKSALAKALFRARMNHIPEETRRANPDGTSSYMRPLPGRARMYPETDVPPIQITKALLKKAEKGESLEEKKQKLLKQLGTLEMADKMLRSRNLQLYERLIDQGADPMLAATTLENTLISLRREGIEIKNVDEVLPEIFALHEKKKIVKSAIPEILKAVAGGKSVHDVAKEFTLISGTELSSLVKSLNYDIKAIMSKYRTRVDPEELHKVLKR